MVSWPKSRVALEPQKIDENVSNRPGKQDNRRKKVWTFENPRDKRKCVKLAWQTTDELTKWKYKIWIFESPRDQQKCVKLAWQTVDEFTKKMWIFESPRYRRKCVKLAWQTTDEFTKKMWIFESPRDRRKCVKLANSGWIHEKMVVAENYVKMKSGQATESLRPEPKVLRETRFNRFSGNGGWKNYVKKRTWILRETWFQHVLDLLR